MLSISVIVPLYNEGEAVNELVAHLRQIPDLHEVVLADASDQPRSRTALARLQKNLTRQHNQRNQRDQRTTPIRILQCPTRARAAQMNAAAKSCRGTVLLFLHCDTRLPRDCATAITRALTQTNHHQQEKIWGWFRLRLHATGARYRLLERMINLRARLSRIATGDQAIFIQRRAFTRAHGFADIALMEDIELSRRLKRLAHPCILPQAVTTSARRWQQNGWLRTILHMWKLRLYYWLGMHPNALAARYQNVR